MKDINQFLLENAPVIITGFGLLWTWISLAIGFKLSNICNKVNDVHWSVERLKNEVEVGLDVNLRLTKEEEITKEVKTHSYEAEPFELLSSRLTKKREKYGVYGRY